MMNIRIVAKLAVVAFTLSACTNQTKPSAPTVPDTTAPTITLGSSTSSMTVAGNLTLTAIASDDVGVSSVEFFKNGSSLGTVNKNPFSKIVSITIADNGKLEFTASVKDAAGNSGTSEPMIVNVNIAAPVQPDTTPPTISLTSSASSFSKEGSLILTATANDDVGVTSVEFFKNGSSLGKVTQSPFTKDVPIRITDNGNLEFKATASDAAGNTKTSNPINVTGNIKPIWPQQFGTSEHDYATGIALTDDGGMVVAGTTYGEFTGFTNVISYDAFIAKYDVNGKQVWLTQFGSNGEEGLVGIALDASGNVFVAGYTSSALPGFTTAGDYDLFVAKFDPKGKQTWLKQFGTSGYDVMNGIVADGGGNVIVTGLGSTSFNGLTSLGESDAFIAKYDTNGTQTWLKQFGTNSGDVGAGVSVDRSNNIFVGGFTLGAFNGFTNAGNNDVFLAKYSANGNPLWVKQFGTSETDEISAITVDNAGNLIATASTAGAFTGFSNAGPYDPVIAKYDTNGNRVWLRQFGTGKDDRTSSVAVEGNNLIVSGYTDGALGNSPNLGSFYDAFVTKYDGNGNQIWLRQFGTNQSDSVLGTAVDPNGNIFVTGIVGGEFSGFTKIGLNSDAFIDSLTSNGFQR